jgi:peptide deformylase
MINLEKVANDSLLLRTICDPVEVVDDKIRLILDDMVEYCRNSVRPHTLSLAANQVGISKRLIVIFENEEILKLADPVIEKTLGRQVFLEGCANTDTQDIFMGGFVERPAYIEARALNYDNQEVKIKANGILAVMLQHEIDHLNGIMYTDKLIGKLIKFNAPEDRVAFRKKHPLRIIEQPIYDDENINRLNIIKVKR